MEDFDEQYDKLVDAIHKINEASTLLLKSLSQEQMVEVAKEMPVSELKELLTYYEGIEEYEICSSIKTGLDAQLASCETTRIEKKREFYKHGKFK